MGTEHLLEVVVSRANSVSKQISDDNVSCRATVTQISISSIPTISPSSGQVTMSNFSVSGATLHSPWQRQGLWDPILFIQVAAKMCQSRWPQGKFKLALTSRPKKMVPSKWRRRRSWQQHLKYVYIYIYYFNNHFLAIKGRAPNSFASNFCRESWELWEVILARAKNFVCLVIWEFWCIGVLGSELKYYNTCNSFSLV